jgi:hypothetical protein
MSFDFFSQTEQLSLLELLIEVYSLSVFLEFAFMAHKYAFACDVF